DLSAEQLQVVAKTLGKRWEKAALHLGLKNEVLEDIKKEEIAEFMQRRKMLRLWKEQRPGKATAQDLLRGLEGLKVLPDNTRRLLEGFCGNPSFSSGQESHPDPTFPSTSLPKIPSHSSSGQGSLSKSELSGPVDSESSPPFAMPGSTQAGEKTKRKSCNRSPGKAKAKEPLRDVGQDLTDNQLLKVAEKLGKEWKPAAIYLGLKPKDLDDIMAKHRTLLHDKYKMLMLWKHRRPPGKAKAQDLLKGLEKLKDLPVETRRLLKVFSTEEKDSVMEDQRSRAGQAWRLIDMVIGKGERASLMMINSMKKRDPNLCCTLGLFYSEAAVGEHVKNTSADLMTSGSSGEGSLSRSGTSSRMDLGSSFPHERSRSWHDTNRGQALTGMQLLQVAETLGQEWRRVGVHLGLSTTDLDDIKEGEKDVTMQKLKMLVLWKRRTPSEATAQDLLRGLQDLKDLPVKTYQLLRGSLLAGSQEVKASYKVSPTETKGRTSELILSSEQFKTEKLKDRDNIYAVMAPANRTRMALLITNVHFDKEKDRDGAEKDEEDMSKLLISLGYNVEQHRDLSGAEMDEAVKRFSKEPRLAATDSVFVVIMSHGVKGAILGVRHCDGVPDQFPIDNIYKHLDSARCPKLLNKPKVIIIQACRGVDDGSAIVCDGPGSVPEQAPVVQVDAALPPHLADEVDAGIEEDAIHRVHKEKDMVSFLSCTADTVSFRHQRQGSFFIQHIVEIFNRHAHEDHIEKLFKRVLKRFEDEPPSADRRQMAVKDRCTLTRDFYLFPGL
ncbi:unnamed protein product, partial [Gadus morhua 'NCC']